MTYNDNLSQSAVTDAYGGQRSSAPISIPLPELGPNLTFQQPWVSGAESSTPYALNIIPARIKGRATEFRNVVTVTTNAMGMTLTGKAVPTGAAFVMSYFFLGLLLTEFAMRRQKSLPIPWSDVEVIRLDPATLKGVVCYHLPGKTRALFSLGFKTADLATLNDFQQKVRIFAPEKVEEGTVKSMNTVAIVLITLAVVIALVFALAALQPNPH